MGRILTGIADTEAVAAPRRLRRAADQDMGPELPPEGVLGALLRALDLDLAGIILGTHHEKGAFTFWSYAIGLPLPSSAILSWKFCSSLHSPSFPGAGAPSP